MYVGGLRSDVEKYDLEDAFSDYGKVRRFYSFTGLPKKVQKTVSMIG